MVRVLASQDLRCFHCGDFCKDDSIAIDDKLFCCRGCKFVFELLQQNNLDSYYQIDKAPGIQQQETSVDNRFAYLDTTEIVARLLEFSDGDLARITLSLPQIHCSSCIWLLENLNRLDKAIIGSRVNFLRKEVTVTYHPSAVSLRQVVELLASIGYEPRISLQSVDLQSRPKKDTKLYKQLAVAGFAFANIMLLSFPEYLSGGAGVESDFKRFFGYLNLLLAIPVLVYSARDYFSSAYHGLRQRLVNMDVPISLGIVMLFARSSVEIITGHGVGYMDSFSGLVFFLLIGKLFQKKTYDSLSFERDYTSYFPLSVRRVNNGAEENVLVTELDTGDHVVIHNQELIPADSRLLSAEAHIDYSFVSGESTPVTKLRGGHIFAGGRQIGTLIEIEVIKPVSRSYITQLWNNDVFRDGAKSRLTELSNRISRAFTFTVLALAAITTVYWLLVEPSRAINAATAILIIACPCALALSTPFTLGTAQRLLGRGRLYLKNSSVVESLATVDTVVFDKTGTITSTDRAALEFNGLPISAQEASVVKSLAAQSTHFLSRKIVELYQAAAVLAVSSFREEIGRGLEGVVDGRRIRLGSAFFVGANTPADDSEPTSSVHLSIDNTYRGCFHLKQRYRAGLEPMIRRIANKFSVWLISGDNSGERQVLSTTFTDPERLLFNQSPQDKLAFVDNLQKSNRKVLMLGDGLNDAGALAQSDIGIAVNEDVMAFTPASDAILDASKLHELDKYLQFASRAIKIVWLSFGISFLYNLIGLSVAMQGELSPLFAAVLMPASSISVVLFATLATRFQASRLGIE